MRLRKRADGEPLLAQGWKKPRKRFEGLIATAIDGLFALDGRTSVVQEHNSTGPDRGQHCVNNCRNPGTRPVSRVY